jgi:hypothetical protein
MKKMKMILASTLIFGAMVAPALAATATLTWSAPTARTDGSPIVGALTFQVWDVETPVGAPANPPLMLGAGVSPYTTLTLDPGAHSFYIIACEAGGACSAQSNTAAVTVAPAPPAPPNAITDLSANVNAGP